MWYTGDGDAAGLEMGCVILCCNFVLCCVISYCFV